MASDRFPILQAGQCLLDDPHRVLAITILLALGIARLFFQHRSMLHERGSDPAEIIFIVGPPQGGDGLLFLLEQGARIRRLNARRGSAEAPSSFLADAISPMRSSISTTL